MKKILKLLRISTLFSLLIGGLLFINGDLNAADVNITPNFFSIKSNKNIVLTISGPEDVHLSIKKRGDISVDTIDSKGNTLPDGSYTYEFYSEPELNESTKNILKKSRVTGDMSAIKALRKSGILPSESSAQSGHFTIKDGYFVVSEDIVESESSLHTDYNDSYNLSSIGDGVVRAFDQQIQDDLVVVGSLCVGIDCVSGENFSFDTIRLKENNVRIKFQDTSNSSSFPTGDWEIIANDSVNGGANLFAIKDVDSDKTPFSIIQGAPSNSIFVASTGNVGFNTSTPLMQLHTVTSNSPTLRLDQDQGAGFAAQAWDVGGNETNFFVRDVTNNGQLPLRIQANAPNASLFIARDGDIGFQTTTPDGKFDVAHSADANNHAFFISPVSDVGININNGFLPRGLFDVQTFGGVSRFMVRSDGNVGIGMGTAGTPAGLFDIQVGGVSRFLVQSDGDVGIGTNAPVGRFHLRDSANTKDYFGISATGDVGMGTTAPSALLHIKPDITKAAKIIVEDTQVAVATRNLLHLKNNGTSTITFENTNDSTTWTTAAGAAYNITNSTTSGSIFSLSPTGNLTIGGCLQQDSSCSSGGGGGGGGSDWTITEATDYTIANSNATVAPLLLTNTGNLTIGGNTFIIKNSSSPWTTTVGANYTITNPSSGTPFDLTADGDLEIGGGLSEGSDRNNKKNIVLANHQEILEKVANLPIAYWSYKFNDDAVRHIGPVAQDFYNNFGVGVDDKHIATLDTSGVALSAIKAIYHRLMIKEEELKERDKSIIKLQKENEEMAERLSYLEDKVFSILKKRTTLIKNKL